MTEKPLDGDVSSYLAELSRKEDPEEWEERLKAAVEETLRKREAKRAERQMFALRRMHGLAARHAAKLARLKKEQEES